MRDGVSGMVVDEPEETSFSGAIEQFFLLPRTQRVALEANARSDSVALSYERHLDALRSSFYRAAEVPLPTAESAEQ